MSARSIPKGSGRRQRGVALLMAVLIAALAASIAATMIARLDLDIRRSETLFHGAQARAYGLGAERWAAQILGRDAEENDIDHLNEPWARRIQPLPLEGGSLTGRIHDLQGRFNVNALLDDEQSANKPAVDIFQRLLANLDLDPQIANAVLDWLDNDQTRRFPGGAEDAFYMDRSPGYRTADQRMVAISELRMVNGIDREAFRALASHVSALPEATAINVNTATPEVLRAVAQGLGPGDAEALVEDRGEQGYSSISDFEKHRALAGKELPSGMLTVSSSYFLVEARVNIGSTNVHLYSWLRRGSDEIRVLSRSRASRY